ncbi:hypothetical protein EG68_08338 [Paragonimus skrjabini miyazakii]|uniref:Uncharacterized protein n=1 Tax=Paragonimus skrjabini miyazakii TaxID=59628 RepID=A0A8S9YCP1_9TREM|nr:hypothetical protein EG68_08338 [Paragonimus skrjabini miyazakii]
MHQTRILLSLCLQFLCWQTISCIPNSPSWQLLSHCRGEIRYETSPSRTDDNRGWHIDPEPPVHNYQIKKPWPGKLAGLIHHFWAFFPPPTRFASNNIRLIRLRIEKLILPNGYKLRLFTQEDTVTYTHGMANVELSIAASSVYVHILPSSRKNGPLRLVLKFSCIHAEPSTYLATHKLPVEMCKPLLWDSGFGLPEWACQTRFMKSVSEVQCLPFHEICDNVQNCLNGEEAKEMCHHELYTNDVIFPFNNHRHDWREEWISCSPGYRPCPRIPFSSDAEECIPAAWLCDGTEDCSNGIDESENWCHSNTPNSCPSETYACPADAKCLPYQLVCNENQDCFNGFDETQLACRWKINLIKSLYDEQQSGNSPPKVIIFPTSTKATPSNLSTTRLCKVTPVGCKNTTAAPLNVKWISSTVSSPVPTLTTTGLPESLSFQTTTEFAVSHSTASVSNDEVTGLFAAQPRLSSVFPVTTDESERRFDPTQASDLRNIPGATAPSGNSNSEISTSESTLTTLLSSSPGSVFSISTDSPPRQTTSSSNQTPPAGISATNENSQKSVTEIAVHRSNITMNSSPMVTESFLTDTPSTQTTGNPSEQHVPVMNDSIFSIMTSPEVDTPVLPANVSVELVEKTTETPSSSRTTNVYQTLTTEHPAVEQPRTFISWTIKNDTTVPADESSLFNLSDSNLEFVSYINDSKSRGLLRSPQKSPDWPQEGLVKVKNNNGKICVGILIPDGSEKLWVLVFHHVCEITQQMSVSLPWGTQQLTLHAYPPSLNASLLYTNQTNIDWLDWSPTAMPFEIFPDQTNQTTCQLVGFQSNVHDRLAALVRIPVTFTNCAHPNQMISKEFYTLVGCVHQNPCDLLRTGSFLVCSSADSSHIVGFVNLTSTCPWSESITWPIEIVPFTLDFLQWIRQTIGFRAVT